MCLTINSAVHKKRFGKCVPIKTEEDLIVYKCVKADWNEEDIKCVTSLMMNFTYIINNVYCTKFGIEYIHKNYYVYEGFHSYLDKEFVKRSVMYDITTECNCLAICIIPKGSEVFLSRDRDIVSNKIKIIGVERI